MRALLLVVAVLKTVHCISPETKQLGEGKRKKCKGGGVGLNSLFLLFWTVLGKRGGWG